MWLKNSTRNWSSDCCGNEISHSSKFGSGTMSPGPMPLSHSCFAISIVAAYQWIGQNCIKWTRRRQSGWRRWLWIRGPFSILGCINSRGCRRSSGRWWRKWHSGRRRRSHSRWWWRRRSSGGRKLCCHSLLGEQSVCLHGDFIIFVGLLPLVFDGHHTKACLSGSLQPIHSVQPYLNNINQKPTQPVLCCPSP